MLYSRLGCYSWPADYCLPPRGEAEVLHPIGTSGLYLFGKDGFAPLAMPPSS